MEEGIRESSESRSRRQCAAPTAKRAIETIDARMVYISDSCPLRHFGTADTMDPQGQVPLDRSEKKNLRMSKSQEISNVKSGPFEMPRACALRSSREQAGEPFLTATPLAWIDIGNYKKGHT